MKKFKKLLALFCCVLSACALAIGLVACGEEKDDAPGDTNTEQPANPDDGKKPAEDTLEGLWTGATYTENDSSFTFSISAKLDGDNALAVVEAERTVASGTRTYYTGLNLAKQEDGSYKGKVRSWDVTGKYTADKKLEVTLPGAMLFSSEESIALTFTTKAALPTNAPSITGKLYIEGQDETNYFDFTEKKVSMGSNGTEDFTLKTVGSYLLVLLEVDGDEYCYVILKDGDDFYGAMDASSVKLTQTKPVESYTVSAMSEGGPGEVTLSPSANSNGKYTKGTKVTVNITPDTGYEIDTVKVNGTAISANEGVYSFEVTQNTTVVVTFKPVQAEEYTVTLTPVDAGQGTVTLSPSANASGKYAKNAKVTINVTPNTGFEIDAVKVNGTDIDPVENVYSFTVTEATTVTVTFRPVQTTVNIPAEYVGDWGAPNAGNVGYDSDEDAAFGTVVAITEHNITYEGETYVPTVGTDSLTFSMEADEVKLTYVLSFAEGTSEKVLMMEGTLEMDGETEPYGSEALLKKGDTYAAVTFDNELVGVWAAQDGGFPVVITGNSVKIGEYDAVVVATSGTAYTVVYNMMLATLTYTAADETPLVLVPVGVDPEIAEAMTVSYKKGALYTFNFYMAEEDIEGDTEPRWSEDLAVAAGIPVGDALYVNTPNKSYYEFNGWFYKKSDAEGGEPTETAFYADTFVPSEFGATTINIYAKWTQVEALPSANQSPTEEEPIVIGADGSVAGGAWGLFADTNPRGGLPTWVGKIKVGEKVTMTGESKSLAGEPYQGVVAHLFYGVTLRDKDGGVCINHINWGAVYDYWAVSKTTADIDPSTVTSLMASGCDITVVWDWTKNENLVEITITYTEKGEGTKTATATYAYNGVDLTSHYTELSIGLGVDNAWAKITDISTEEAEEAPAKGVVLGTDGNTIGYTPTVSRTAISAGEKIVLTGTMTAGSENAQGYTVALVGTGTDDGNGFPTYVFRPDHCINAPNAFPNAPTNTFDFGWTVTMSDVSDWSAFNAAKADCETTLTIDWTNKAQIVITEKFGDTQSITYTITATEGHALDNSYQVVLGADHCFTTFTSVVRTAAPAAAE